MLTLKFSYVNTDPIEIISSISKMIPNLLTLTFSHVVNNDPIESFLQFQK